MESYNTLLAEKLLNQFDGSMSSDSDANEINNISKDIDSIIKACTDVGEDYPDRQKILLKVAELIGNPVTPKQRYIIAMAFSMSRVQYRKEAIQYLSLYVENELDEDQYKDIMSVGSKYHLSDREKMEYHLSFMYDELGRALEGEYLFEDALEAYLRALELTPYDFTKYAKVSNVYVKLNRLDLAKETFEQAKQNEMYQPYFMKDDSFEEKMISWHHDKFKEGVDINESRLQEKIDKGYIYKPRKRKN